MTKLGHEVTVYFHMDRALVTFDNQKGLTFGYSHTNVQLWYAAFNIVAI